MPTSTDDIAIVVRVWYGGPFVPLLESMHPIKNLIVVVTPQINDKQVATITRECEKLHIVPLIYRTRQNHMRGWIEDISRACIASPFSYYIFVEQDDVLHISDTKWVDNLTEDQHMIAREYVVGADTHIRWFPICSSKNNLKNIDGAYPFHRRKRDMSDSDYVPDAQIYVSGEKPHQRDGCLSLQEVLTRYQKHPSNDNFEDVLVYCENHQDFGRLTQYCDIYINCGNTPWLIYAAIMLKAKHSLHDDAHTPIVLAQKAHEITGFVEPLIVVAKHHMQQGNYKLAYSTMYAACTVPNYPTNTCVEVCKSDYTTMRWTLMRHLSYRLDIPLDMYMANTKLLGHSHNQLSDNKKSELHFHNAIITKRLSTTFRRRSDAKFILMHASGGNVCWDNDIASNPGVGRTEIFAMHMMRCLRETGYHCMICCNTPSVFDLGGIECVPLSDYDSIIGAYHIDTLVVVDNARFLRYGPSVATAHLWIQAEPFVDHIPYNRKLRTIIVPTLSQMNSAKKSIPKKYHSLVNVVCNGVNTGSYYRKNIPTIPMKFIFNGRDMTALDVVLTTFPKIRRAYPDATLHVYADHLGHKQRSIMDKYPYIHEYPRVPHDEVADIIKTCDYWLYPTLDPKTCCITAYEMQAARVVCLYTALPHLTNIVGGRGVVVTPTAGSILNAIQDLEKHPMKKNHMLNEACEWAMDMNWVEMAATADSIFSRPGVDSDSSLYAIPLIVRQTPIKFVTSFDDEALSRGLIERGVYDSDLTEWLVNNLTSDTSFIDIGCYIGYYSVLCSMYCKRVYSYDICDRHIQISKRNVESNNLRNIKLHLFGFGREKTHTNVWTRGEDTGVGDYSLTPFSETSRKKNQKLVRVETLDDIFKRRQSELSRVVMKIDVDGDEPHIIEGGGEFIRGFKPIIIVRHKYEHLIDGYKIQLNNHTIIIPT